MLTVLEKIEDAFANISSVDAMKSYVEAALTEHTPPAQIMQSMRNGLARAGRKYEQGEYFLSELIMSGILAQEVSTMLKPLLLSSKNEFSGKIVICTVKGDIHDLGKNLVSMMLSSVGFEVVDLGVDVPSEKILDAVGNEGPGIVAMSCLLTSAMNEMQITIDKLKSAGARISVKILVGGRPITKDFASKIGADGYAEDAIESVTVAREVLQIKRSSQE